MSSTLKRTSKSAHATQVRAFTLVESVVVIFIISILLTLSAVSVGQMRERARETSCGNSIRQVAIAVQLYESRERKMPAIMDAETEASIWFELANDLSINIRLSDYLPVFPSRNHPKFVPGVMKCPSDVGKGSNYRFNVGSTLSWQPDLTRYVPDAGNGVIVYGDKPLVAASIRDGLSQTALVCERLSGLGFDQAQRSIATGPYLEDLSSPTDEEEVLEYIRNSFSTLKKTHDGGEVWTIGVWRTTGYNHLASPQTTFSGTFNGGEGWWSNFGIVPPTSAHASGVVLATCDGAVRTVSENVDLAVWKALGTRAAGD